jgi:hypothetical protein
MSRDTLHQLVNRIPENDLIAAQRYLEYLATSQVYRAALAAAPDDEPVTEGDAQAIERTAVEIRAGKVVEHQEILREFGIE